MLPDMLTEDMPSSGDKECDHKWKEVKDATIAEGQVLLVCDKCSASKLVEKPKIKESKGDGKLLLG